MKNGNRFLISFTVLLMIVLLCSFQVSAHEVFCDNNGNPAELRWTHWYLGVFLSLETNNDYLAGCLADNYVSMYSRWNASDCPVYAADTSFSYSDVDFCTPTQTWWNNHGYYSTWAITYLYDTNNDLTMSYNDAINSTGIIDYAAIYVNPDDDCLPDNSTTQTKILVHESGHALCLGHPTRSYYDPIPAEEDSIMRTGALGYDSPQDHEHEDLDDMYY